MRAFIPLLLLGACAESIPVEDAELSFVALEAAPPPGSPLTLSAGQASAGAPFTINIGNADPGEGVYLVRTTGGMGAGPCPPSLGGTCIDIVTPTVMGPYTASGGGTVSLSPTLPPAMPYGTNLCIQAVARRGPGGVNTVKSPVVCRVTNNGPVVLEGGLNTGDTFSPITTMGGPNLSLGMKYTAPSQLVVGYIEVFTGLLHGANSVEIWTHDPAAYAPGTMVASATWNMAANEEWQGASLGQRFVMPQGSEWWIVWKPQDSSRASVETTGTNTDYRGTFTGGAPWNGPFSGPWKFKLCGGGGCP